MMRTISHLNRVSKFAFSSQVSAQMTDWEYTTKIQQSLQQNDINEALKYLINVDVYVCRVIWMGKC